MQIGGLFRIGVMFTSPVIFKDAGIPLGFKHLLKELSIPSRIKHLLNDLTLRDLTIPLRIETFP